MTDNRPQLSILYSIVLPDVFLCTLLALGPALWVRITGLFAFSCVTFASLKSHHTLGDPVLDYALGGAFLGSLFNAVHILLLTKPVDEIRHERDTFKVSARELPFWRRIHWVFCILRSPRGPGWSYQVSRLPSRPHVSHGQFLFSRSLWALWYIVLIDVAQTYQHTHPVFHLTGDAARSIASEGYFRRCVNIVAFMSLPYAMLNLQYTIYALVSVALGATYPADWSDLFGKWSDCTTVRKFWGQSWHQNLRCYHTSIGRWVSNALGFKRGTNGSSYTQLYVAFILSGLMHMGGDWMVDPPSLGASFPFFFLQAIAITAEDAVIALGNRIGVRESTATHVLGYVWTFVWFSWSIVGYIDWSTKTGIGLVEMMPFSVSRSIGKAAGWP